MIENILRKTKITTSLITLLPLITGLFLYKELPPKIAVHFGLTGLANRFDSKPMVVFVFPILLLFLQLLLFTLLTRTNKNTNFRMINVSCWIVPLVANVSYLTIYGVALGYKLKMSIIANALLGVIFIIFGNYLPKTKPNNTVGIRLPWTLASKVNWQKTHRLAGWIFVISGFALFITSILSNIWIMFVIIVLSVLIPTIYSYCLSRKNI